MALTTEDIIRTDRDRVFIVDHNCAVIFTGDSSSDSRPLIRVGPWHHMPRRYIPLVENIIIPLSPTPDPDSEIECLDGDLENNTLTGPAQSLDRLVAFMKEQGINTGRLRLFRVETDLPELSGQQKLSMKDAIAGVFSMHGNFTVSMHGESIFNLKDHLDRVYGSSLIHLDMEEWGTSDYYQETGIVMFHDAFSVFDRGTFNFAGFPGNYLELFSQLGVKPGSITAISAPRTSHELERFFMWKSSTGKELTVFTDQDRLRHLSMLAQGKSQVNPLDQSLFTSHDWAMAPLRYAGSWSLVKKGTGIPTRILILDSNFNSNMTFKEPHDVMILSTGVFIKNASLLRNNPGPVMVYGPHQEQVRCTGMSVLPFFYHARYTFTTVSSIEQALKHINLDERLLKPLYAGDETAMMAALEASSPVIPNKLALQALYYSLQSLAGFLLFFATDREQAARLKNIHSTITGLLDRAMLHSESKRLRVRVLIYEQGLLEIMEKQEHHPRGVHRQTITGEVLRDPLCPDLYRRILRDRERLDHVLEQWDQSREASLPKSEPIPSITLPPVKHKFRKISPFQAVTGVALVTSLLVGSALFLTVGKPDNQDPGSVQSKPSMQDQHREMPATTHPRNDYTTLNEMKRVMARNRERWDQVKTQYGTSITDRDILRYSSRVAVKNGYAPLDMTGIKDKNPHWIFPGTIFSMHDGEKVMVTRGDTLWDICRIKLVLNHVHFYSLIEQAEKKSGSKRKELLNSAEVLAITKQQRKHLRELKGGRPGN